MSRYYITSTIFLVLLIASLMFDGTINIPSYWYVALVLIYTIITVYGSAILSASFFVPVKSGSTGNKIALTFDDGPMPGKTERVLDILADHNVPATFFCIGNRVAGNPEIVKRINQEGHLIGNHTYWHGAFFDLKSSGMVATELRDTDNAIFAVIGKRPKYFRPPYGVTNPMIAKAIRRMNYTVIGWKVRSLDTVIKDPEKLFKRVTRSLKGGEIILFHDHSDSMIRILPDFLEYVKNRGLKIVSVDTLLNEKPYA